MAKRLDLERKAARRRFRLAAILLLLLVPAILLRDTLFFGHSYVPFDLTTFAPFNVELEPAEIEARREGSNFDVTEKLIANSPEFRLAHEEIADGRFPHWNPYARIGAPLFANTWNGFAHPAHWLLLWLDPDRTYGFVAWISFALAGLCMFGFLREIGLRRQASLFGAIIFQLSGTLAANAHFFMRMEPLALLPAAFWALERLYKHRGIRRIPPFAGFVIALSLTWLAGFPPFALVCSFAYGLWMFTLTLRSLRLGGRRNALRFALWSIGATGLGIAAAAVQIMPMQAYFPDSQRVLDQGSAALAGGGFDPLGLLGFLLPAPFGDPTLTGTLPYDRNPLLWLLSSLRNPETGQLIEPTYSFTEYSVYCGILPLLCVLIAFMRPSVRFRTYALGTLCFFLVLSAGGFVFRLVSWIPGLAAGAPMRFAGIACFLIAALAAMGIETGPGRLRRRQRHVLAGLCSLFLVACIGIWIWATRLANAGEDAQLWVYASVFERFRDVLPGLESAERVKEMGSAYLVPALENLARQALRSGVLLVAGLLWILVHGKKRTRLLPSVVLLVSGLELFFLAERVNPSVPVRELPDTPVHAFLRGRQKAMSASGGFRVARIAETASPPDAFPPNLLTALHIRDLNAYTFADARSHRPFERIYGASQLIRGYSLKAFPVDDRLDHGVFDLFGVRYLLSTRRFESLGEPVIAPYEGPGGAFFVYERKRALPRAFLVPRASVAEDDAEVLRAVCSLTFDPRRTLMIQENDGGPPPPGEARRILRSGRLRIGATGPPKRAGQASVRFLEDEASQVRVQVRSSPGAWLVLTDAAMPNWHAEVDGADVYWWRANLCFRAVWIPRGDHEVVMQYDAHVFQNGLWLSAGALAVLLVLLAWWNGSHKRTEPDHDVIAARGAD